VDGGLVHGLNAQFINIDVRMPLWHHPTMMK
jgi:hypothetical protein